MTKIAPSISIILLMHNVNPWLLKCSEWCFKSIKEHTIYPAYELIVVDNASNTDGWEELNKSFIKQGAIVVRHEENLGMTGGFNSGIEIASTEFVFLVENDIIVTNFWVTNALACFAKNPKCALIKASEDDTLRDDSDRHPEKTNQEEFYKKIQDSNLPYLRKWANSKPGNLDDKGYGVDAWTSLWCCAFRMSALKDIGNYFFDEKIGLNWDEDIDLIWRLRDAGWSTLLNWQMYVFHRAAQTCQLKGEYAASPEKEAGRRYFQKKHDLVYSEHGWATRRVSKPAGEAMGHKYHEYGETFEYGVGQNEGK